MKKKNPVDEGYAISLYVRWEGLRRNENFRRDYEKFEGKKIDEITFNNKWGIPPTHPDLTFSEIFEAYGYHTRYHKGAKRWPFPIEYYLDPKYKDFGPPIICNVPLALVHNKKLKEMEIVLNLNYSKGEIKTAFDHLLERLDSKTTTRGKSVDAWERRFKVWDLREQCYPYRDINYELGSPGIDTVKKDYQRAFEQIYRQDYDPSKLKEKVKKSKDFKKACEACKDKNCFKGNQLCPVFAKLLPPEIIDYKSIGGDEGEGLMNLERYKEWQEEENN